jgi:hypothetical protein
MYEVSLSEAVKTETQNIRKMACLTVKAKKKARKYVPPGKRSVRVSTEFWIIC